MRPIFFAVLAMTASVSAPAATIYRCQTAHGPSYQDVPCRGRDYASNLVDIGEPSVVRNDRRDSLGQWADQLDQDNRKRELEQRAQRLQLENQADTAEFAALVEQIDAQKNASSQGAADVPSVLELEDQQYQAQREYRSRIERRDAELGAVKSEMSGYEQ